VALSQPQSMLEAMKESDVPARLVTIPGKFHSVAYEFKKPPSLDGKTVFEASVDWLHQYVDRSQEVTPSPPPTPTGPTPEDSGGLDDVLLFGALGAVVVMAGAGLVVSWMRRR
jgi:hypothetical protein